MIQDLKLRGNELLVYAEIASNLNKVGEFQKTYKTIMKDTGLIQRTIERSLDSLKKKKLINIKRVRDGRPFVINIITLNHKQLNIIKDEQFNYIISFWGKCIAKEDINQINYDAYRLASKDPEFKQEDLKTAILWYGETLHTEGYYKTFIYKFNKFMALYKKYLPGGYEYESLMAWKVTNKANRFTISDRPYNPEDEDRLPSIDDLDLGNMEM